MLESALQVLSDTLFAYLSGNTKCSYKGLLLKKHSDNLLTHGEISFPSSCKPWKEFLNLETSPDKESINLLHFRSITHQDIMKNSKDWNLHIRDVKEEKGRVYLFLDRPFAISVGFSEALRNHATILLRLKEKSSNVSIDPLCEVSNCITSLRVKYLSKVIENLCSLYVSESRLPDIFVTSKSSSTNGSAFRVLCSTVLSAKTGTKEAEVNADDFIRLRQNEMTLIAQHKYGVRVSTDSKWQEFIAHLGESAVAFELLQSRPTSAVKINLDNSSAGSSKGASFVLYNCARLETIIKTYNDKVDEGYYPPLPKSNQVDFSLLTQEDEWILIYNYIMGFPSLLDSCVEITEKSCEFRPHYICNFLSSMVRVFSQYYRRTRILVEPRHHLLPTIHARMHMLKILNETLKTCLRILNIKSVSQM